MILLLIELLFLLKWDENIKKFIKKESNNEKIKNINILEYRKLCHKIYEKLNN